MFNTNKRTMTSMHEISLYEEDMEPGFRTLKMDVVETHGARPGHRIRFTYSVLGEEADAADRSTEIDLPSSVSAELLIALQNIHNTLRDRR